MGVTSGRAPLESARCLRPTGRSLADLERTGVTSGSSSVASGDLAVVTSEGVEPGVDGEASPGRYHKNLHPDRNDGGVGSRNLPYPYAHGAWEPGGKPPVSQMEPC
jgi:hypothetical protein